MFIDFFLLIILSSLVSLSCTAPYTISLSGEKRGGSQQLSRLLTFHKPLFSEC